MLELFRAKNSYSERGIISQLEYSSSRIIYYLNRRIIFREEYSMMRIIPTTEQYIILIVG